MPLKTRFLALAGIMVAIAALVIMVRYLGFGHGPVAGMAPSGGIALAAGLWLGLPGALAVGAGFLAGALTIDVPPNHAVVIAVSHALAAWIAGGAMRVLGRRRAERSHIRGHLVFLAVAAIFISVVATVALAAVAVGFVALDMPMRFIAVILLFEPVGILTVFPVIAQARGWRAVIADPWPAVPTVIVGVVLIGVLAFVLATTQAEFTAGATLVLSMPFCFWVATRPRAFDSAALAFVASHVVLWLVLRDAGSVLAPSYILTTLYLNLLMLCSQFVNAVNRDRLAALAVVAAERAELEVRVEERTALLARMTERARAGDAEKTRLLRTVDYELRTPLNGVIGMASLVLAGRLDPATRGNVEMIRRSGFHLLDVVNRILDYSEGDAGATDAESETFDLRPLVAEVIEELNAECSAGAALGFEMGASEVARHGRREGLRRALELLLRRATRFPGADRATLNVIEKMPGVVRFEIGAEEASRGGEDAVFAADDEREGLGRCAEIIERLGGRIGFDLAPDQPPRAWMEVPLPAAGGAMPARLALRA